MKRKTETLLAIAMAGLIAGFTTPHAFAGDAAAPAVGTPKAAAEKGSCKSKQGCKGTKTTAKTEKASCKNTEKASCKNKGHCNSKEKAAAADTNSEAK